MDLSKRRRILNEQLFREQNTELKKLAKSLLPKSEQTSVPIKFICECSRTDCVEPIELTIEEYDQIHRKKNEFVVIEGHEHTDIERVAGRHESYIVVQKPFLKTA